MKEKMLKLLRERVVKLCALATVNATNQPACAILGYAVTDDGSLLLSTHSETMKAQNIKGNCHVALVIGWSFDVAHMQIQGDANVIESGKDHEEADTFFFQANPMAKKFRSADTVFIKVVPQWVRVTDFTASPVEISEGRIGISNQEV